MNGKRHGGEGLRIGPGCINSRNPKPRLFGVSGNNHLMKMSSPSMLTPLQSSGEFHFCLSSWIPITQKVGGGGGGGGEEKGGRKKKEGKKRQKS